MDKNPQYFRYNKNNKRDLVDLHEGRFLPFFLSRFPDIAFRRGLFCCNAVLFPLLDQIHTNLKKEEILHR